MMNCSVLEWLGWNFAFLYSLADPSCHPNYPCQSFDCSMLARGISHLQLTYLSS